MNLPTLALLIETMPLNSLYGSQKVVKEINSVLPDGLTGINSAMTGKQLIQWYKELDYDNQHKVGGIVVFADKDKEFILEQIIQFKETNLQDKNHNLVVYKIITGCIYTVVTLISVAMSIMYSVYAINIGYPIKDTWMDILLSNIASIFTVITENGK